MAKIPPYAVPANGKGGGGVNPNSFAPPIPDWAVLVLADPQISTDPSTAKKAIHKYLTEIDKIEMEYELAVNTAEAAATKAKFEADERLRNVILG